MSSEDRKPFPKLHLIIDISILITPVFLEFTRTSVTVDCIRHNVTKLLSSLSPHYLIYIYGSLPRLTIDNHLRRIDPNYTRHVVDIYAPATWEWPSLMQTKNTIILTQLGTPPHKANPDNCLLLPAVDERELNTTEPLVLGPTIECLTNLAFSNPSDVVDYLQKNMILFGLTD